MHERGFTAVENQGWAAGHCGPLASGRRAFGRFSALQYSGEFSFLVTANEIKACVTLGHMRTQWNFRGVKLPGAWGRIGKSNIALQVTALWNSYCFNSTSFCVIWNNKELSTKSTGWLLKFWLVYKSRLIFCGDSLDLRVKLYTGKYGNLGL